MDNKVTIIGCGPGAADLLTLRASTAIFDAECVVGSRRLIETFARDDQETVIIDGNYSEAITEARRIKREGSRVAFLVSGDPLFCSLGVLLIKEFGKERCEIIPAVGAIPYAFTLLKESSRDYTLLSLHGNIEVDLAEAIRSNEKLAILLDPERNLRWIKSKLDNVETSGRRFFIATNLSLPNEEFKEITFEDFGTIKEESLAILIVKKKDNNG